MTWGMESIGVMVPDRNMMGNSPKKHSSSACCKVLVMEAISTPMAIALNRNTAVNARNRNRLPWMGTPNHQMMNRLGKNPRMPTTSVGTVLARNISQIRVGVTSNCSTVPTSFSRVMVAAE